MRTVILIFAAITLMACHKKTQPQAEPIKIDTVAKITAAIITNPITPAKPVTPPSTPKAIVRYLALGDSYTVGEDVEQKDSFPFQLSGALSAYSLGSPYIVARTGWTTGDLIQAILTGGYVGQTYDVVTLLIGVNDQYQGIDKETYRNNFIYLVNTAITFAKNDKKKVFVVSIPDYGVTPFGKARGGDIGTEIDAFNAINKAESAKAGVNYIDITPESRKAANDPTLTADDSLHPSGKMYALWVKLIAPVVEAQIKKP